MRHLINVHIAVLDFAPSNTGRDPVSKELNRTGGLPS